MKTSQLRAASRAAGRVQRTVSKAARPLRAYGFPSGHVFGATVFVIVGVYLLWALEAARGRRLGAAVGGALFVAAVGYSRIFVNAHWLSDVVGGLMAGIAFGVAMVLVLDTRTTGAAR